MSKKENHVRMNVGNTECNKALKKLLNLEIMKKIFSLGLKLSWVAAERFNPKHADLLSNNPSISNAINDYAKAKLFNTFGI